MFNLNMVKLNTTHLTSAYLMMVVLVKRFKDLAMIVEGSLVIKMYIYIHILYTFIFRIK